jgi:hypothetical protein
MSSEIKLLIVICIYLGACGAMALWQEYRNGKE